MAEIIPLGTRLRQRREELGLSQAQVARELDVARTAYRLWEMEAARPAPDRWRVIAKWLGISMTALLLAGELLDEGEAADAERTAFAAGLTIEAWGEEADRSTGDYFSQERAMIADQTARQAISALQASNLRDVLDRIQDAALSDVQVRWHPGHFSKRLPSTEHAPALARAALAATAVGVPVETFEDAALLTSELVTNSVRHADSAWIDVEITLDADLLRIEVGDQDREPIRPRAPANEGGGWGLTLVGELATRWGVEREPSGKKIWIEFNP
jgi:transcriptional regulator with XRE-family HTH domain/anti-sigma regulatory factor (Ser/Thr protein kinase)